MGTLISPFLVSSMLLAQGAEQFYAYHTKINSGESWEAHSRTARHADLIVQMETGQLIFHRKYSYRPYWKSEVGEWLVNEIIPLATYPSMWSGPIQRLLTYASEKTLKQSFKTLS